MTQIRALLEEETRASLNRLERELRGRVMKERAQVRRAVKRLEQEANALQKEREGLHDLLRVSVNSPRSSSSSSTYPNAPTPPPCDLLILNVGGRAFTVKRATLCQVGVRVDGNAEEEAHTGVPC